MLSGSVYGAAYKLCIAGGEYDSEAIRLGERYGFEVFGSTSELNESVDSYLLLDSEGLSLVNSDNPKEKVRVDFLSGKGGYRLSTMVNTAQPVLKGIGFNKDKVGLRVLDATAGLGVDGMLMAVAGCQVRLIERSPVMAALLEDGLRRAGEGEEFPEVVEAVRNRIILEQGESVEYFAGISEDEYDVIYLDPMFPERKKSSKVKKEMQLARLVADSEDNALELLEAAFSTPVRRVVIKRPLKSPIVRKGFSTQIKGKSIRFDVYLR